MVALASMALLTACGGGKEKEAGGDKKTIK